MDPPPPPFASSSSSSSPSPPPPSSSSASATMVIITVVGILAAFALLASYYAFVTKCQLLRAVWSRHPPWHRRARGPGGIGGDGRDEASSVASRPSATEGLGLPLIRMLPVVKFTAAACDAGACGGVAPRISVSECAVCLSEFEERERVRLLPNCSHAFHIDCIDTWLQGSARCPFCRSDVSLPALPSARRALAATAVSTGLPMRRDDALAGDSIVIEVRGDHERWFSSHGTTTTAGARPATAGARGPRHPPPKQQQQQQRSKAESVGDEAIDTRKTTDAEFAVVQPLRRSLSLDDSSCGKHLYVSIQELLATSQRQVRERDPSVHS